MGTCAVAGAQHAINTPNVAAIARMVILLLVRAGGLVCRSETLSSASRPRAHPFPPALT